MEKSLKLERSMSDKEFMDQLTRWCLFPHRLKQVLRCIEANNPEALAAFIGKTRGAATRRRLVYWLAKYLDWCDGRWLGEYHKVITEPGKGIDKFCTWYNAEEEDRELLSPYLRSRAGLDTARMRNLEATGGDAKAARAQIHRDIATELRRLRAGGKAARSERRRLLSLSGGKIERVDKEQIRRALRRYRSDRPADAGFHIAVDYQRIGKKRT
jgi:hypothetical protein